ncbi:helix-turn-helix domain-containing protein [Saccharothrix syringae]|uniref:helix-turn-helix domain-containing protein n=1 Tax=Saccharothrix syringae TaxID=103733 RepID=UPI001B80BB93
MDGLRALASQGPASTPRLDEAKFARLEQELRKGPTAHGWPDQVWPLSRIKTLIGRRFHLSYRVQGVHLLLRRHGSTRQAPARRAVERDDRAVAGWVKDTWPRVEAPRRRSTPGSSSRTRQECR